MSQRQLSRGDHAPQGFPNGRGTQGATSTSAAPVNAILSFFA